VSRLEQLIDILLHPGYSSRYRSAKSSRTCLICAGAAREFSDEWAKLEYEVSALCQKCQEEYLRGK
jgi:phosphoribosyl-dephospho-CoA transferase